MKTTNKTITRAGTVTLMVAFVAGCATQKQATNNDYFFPPPPNEPRLQFLTAFSSEKTFRGKTDQNMMSFLTGVKPPEKNFGKPYGAAVGDKKLYICDTDLGAVLVVDFQTRRVGAIQAQGECALRVPLNVAVDPNGNVYVADTGREQVVIFDTNGNYSATIGKQDEMKPRDVAVTQDRVYIADLQTHNVHVLDKASHKLLLDIPRKEDQTNRVRGVFTPTNIAIDSKGRVYVSDT